MPINWIDFTKMPIQKSGLDELIPHMLESYRSAYETARMPKKTEQEEQQRELANQLLGHQVNYYPKEHEQNLRAGEQNYQLGALNLGARPGEINDAALTRALENERRIRENKYIDEEKQATIAQHRASAQQSQASATKAQQEVADAIAKAKRAEQRGQQGVAGRPFEDMPSNERLDAVKRMRDAVANNKNIVAVMGNLKKMRKIIDENPDLSETWTSLVVNPNDDSIWNRFLNAAGNKRNKTLVQEFRKLSSDVVSHSLNTDFGANITDARQKLEEARKANPNMTSDAIKFVINNMEHDLQPWPDYVKAVKRGLDNDYEVYQDPEAFRKAKPLASKDSHIPSIYTPDQQMDEWEVVSP